MLTKWAAAAALLGLLSGCGARVLPAPGVPADRAAYTDRPVARSGGSSLRTAIVFAGAPAPTNETGYHTQAIVQPYTAADVDYMRFELWTTGNGPDVLEGEMQTPSGSNANQTIDWSHLRKNTAYRLKVFAMSASGQLLNQGGAATVQDVTTGDDDQMSLAVTVRLADRVFDGTVHPLVNATTIDGDKVDHLSVTLRQKISGSWIRQASQSTPNGSDLSKTVNFGHLLQYTNYRLVVKAIDKKNKTLKTRAVDFQTANDDYVEVQVNL